MNQTVSLPPIRTEKLFCVPIWQSRVPELYGHHAEMKKDIIRAWETGDYKRHRHGYGYQTPATIFFEENMSKFPYFRVLKQAFIQNVELIVKKRVGLATSMHFTVAATLGWILVQTDEDWVSGAWHDHYPATLSACYYLQVPETETEAEGALAFQRPSSQDMFIAQIQRIKPREGDFILFPSSLWHRPEPCPSADGLRISLSMDAYIEWQHQRAEGKPPIPDEEFRRLVNESLS